MSETERLQELEALIFAADTPLSVAAVRKVMRDMTPARVAEAVEQINEQLRETGRPYEIASIAGGYQFRTRAEHGDLLLRAQPERRVRLSKAALETLAVIAYRQPVTRAEIEDVRCVDCGAVIRSLLERDLLRIVGRRDAPGRPALYGTTSAFLETFGLASLRDMPSLRELEPLEEASGGTPGAPASEGDPEPGEPEHDAAAEDGQDGPPTGPALQTAG